jgi:putative membrane protein
MDECRSKRHHLPLETLARTRRRARGHCESGNVMIRGYSDHAANERTFLAWVRTGIAVIAFGFVIEKFNLFVSTLERANITAAGRPSGLGHLSGPLGRYDGFSLILVGIALIALAALRFVRTERLLADEAIHPAHSVRTELIFSVTLAVIAAGLSVLVALG